MMGSASLRLLCMGDNHGHVTSVAKVVEEIEGDRFDYIIHTGDFTNTDEDGLEAGVEQLEAQKPYFEELTQRGEFVYVLGNRDHEAGPSHLVDYVTDHTDFDVGTQIPEEGTIEVEGQAFTQDPALVEPDTILVTHGLIPELLDHFEGKAYFSGHEHTGRYKNRALNTAFLYRGDRHGGKPLEGGYFIVEISDDGV